MKKFHFRWRYFGVTLFFAGLIWGIGVGSLQAVTLLEFINGRLDNYRGGANNRVEVREHDTCKNVVNSTNQEFLIPTRTEAEWEAFQANLPSGVEVQDCSVPLLYSGTSVDCSRAGGETIDIGNETYLCRFNNSDSASGCDLGGSLWMPYRYAGTGGKIDLNKRYACYYYKGAETCRAVGGTWVSSDGGLCKFARSTCPSYWKKYKNWTKTSGKSGSSCRGSCSTGQHNFSNKSQESCSYFKPGRNEGAVVCRIQSGGIAFGSKKRVCSTCTTTGKSGGNCPDDCNKNGAAITLTAEISEIGCRPS